MYSSAPRRKMIARKPSHLGSNDISPAGGNASESFASIGSIGGASVKLAALLGMGAAALFVLRGMLEHSPRRGPATTGATALYRAPHSFGIPLACGSHCALDMSTRAYDPRKSSGATQSSWVSRAEPELDDISELNAPGGAKVDVIVVGAGSPGSRPRISSRTAGARSSSSNKGASRAARPRAPPRSITALDDRYYLLEKLHGADGARLAAESHAQAIESIASIAARESIACDFERVDGYLFAGDPKDPAQHKQLEAELAAARRAGLQVETITDPPLSFDAGSVLRFAGQAQLDPLLYTRGLARAVRAHGGRFALDARVVKLDDTTQMVVHIEDGRTFYSDFVVIATNTPIIDVLAMHTKQAAYRSYAMAFAVEKGSIAKALYWDTASPYHYVRLAGDDDVLIVGGEDHKVGQSSEPEQAWVRLEAWTRVHFPRAARVLDRWSGQVWEPMDGLAFIGQNPGSSDGVLIATVARQRITHALLAA